MAALGLDAGTVNDAVRSEGESIPGGAIQIGERRYNLKGTGDYPSIEAVADTVVAQRDGRTILLRDVAEVEWSTEEPAYLARFNGQRAAFVTANMKDGFSIFEVQRALDTRVVAFRATLPTGAKVESGFVQAENVHLRLRRLGIDFAIAIALVALTLLPLGWRAGGIVMIAIPLSLAMGIAGLWALGYSLNQISIAGFVVALGLLVDDAIVVVENISRFLREGHDRKTAAILATDQIALAVLGCTVILILAFLPLLNLPEGPGKFTRGLPLAVVLTVLASLLVAFTIVPFLASRLLPRHEHAEGTHLLRWVKRGIHRFYAPAVRWALSKPRRSLMLAGGLVLASLGLVPLLGFSLFPAADKPQFLISVSTPEGASLEATDQAVRFVDRILAQTDSVRNRMVNLGRGNPQIYYNVFPSETKTTKAEIFVSLDKWKGEESVQLLENLRRKFSSYPSAKITLEQFQKRAADRSSDRGAYSRPGKRRTVAPRYRSRARAQARTRHSGCGQSAAAATHRLRPWHRHRKGGSVGHQQPRHGPNHSASGRRPRGRAVPRRARRRISDPASSAHRRLPNLCTAGSALFHKPWQR